jgi:hypothetical protein
MARTTRPLVSILTDDSARIATLAVLVLLLGAVTAAGTTAAQSDEPTVRVVGSDVTTSGSASVQVVLSTAPEGLSGYYLRLSVDGTDVARIDGASYPDSFSMTSEPEVEADGQTVLLEAADLDDAIQPGSTDVTLATVDLSGVAPGETRVTVEPVQFDADGGESFDPAAQPDVVTVTSEQNADGSDSSANGDVADNALAGSTGGVGGIPTVVFVGVAALLLGGGILFGRRL